MYRRFRAAAFEETQIINGAMRSESDFCMHRLRKQQRRACDENGAQRDDH
jgi:hypothetical protein